MDVPMILTDVLARSGASKSSLCAAAGVSRALFDEYLKGRRQPSVAQVDRIVAAAGLELEVALTPKRLALSPEFVAVLEFGEIFPRRAPDPLVNIGPLWRKRSMDLHRG